MNTIELLSWEERVADLQAPIANAEHMSFGVVTVIRKLFVDMQALQEAIQQHGEQPSALLIYADVVHFPDRYRMSLASASMVIAARRIEAAGANQIALDYRSDDSAALQIYTQELAGRLAITAVMPAGAAQPADFLIADMPQIGVEVSLSDGRPMRSDLPALPPEMLDGASPFVRSLGTIFHLASLIGKDDPASARAMLRWVNTCAAQSAATDALEHQSAELLAIVQAEAAGVPLVPQFSPALYTAKAQSFFSAASLSEQALDAAVGRIERLEMRKEDAQLLLKLYAQNTTLIHELISQSQSDLQEAKLAVTAALNTLGAHKLSAEQAQTAFKSGLHRWEEDAKLKAAFDIITGIMNIAAAIGVLAATAGTAGVGGAGTASSSVATFTNVAKTVTVTLVSVENSTSGVNVKDLIESIERIAKIIESLAQVATLTDQLISAIHSIDTDSVSGAIDAVLAIPEQDSLSSAVYWEQFKLQATHALSIAIANNVPNASEYQLQLDLLVVAGLALSTSQQRALQSGRELARLLLQKQSAEQQEAILRAQVDKLETQALPARDLIEQLFEVYLDLKRWLYVAVSQYGCAYRYWSLRPSTTEPAMDKNVISLSRDLAKIRDDVELALKTFTPQSLENFTFAIDDPAVLLALRERGLATYAFALDEQTFLGLDRIRLKRVRVWLEGAKSQAARPIRLLIGTSGQYADRLKGESYLFQTSTPWQLAFQYASASRQVLVDGSIDEDQRLSYFAPTPFTEWQIRLPLTLNVGLDLSELSAITIEFAGSAVAQRDMS